MTKYFSENLMEIEMKKTKSKMNIPIYLRLSILGICKTLMYEFLYDYIKPKYQDRGKLFYMDSDSFVVHIKAENFYEDIANDVEKRFDTLSYNKDDKRLLTIGKSKKVISLFKDELVGKIMKEFAALTAKAYAYLMDDDTERKKSKGKKCVIKRELMFKNYKDFLFNPFYSSVTFVYLLKTSENQRFSDVFRGYENVTLD